MKPKICAHRGIVSKYQENSIDAIKEVKNTGAEMVEFDTQKTRDGVWILHHDSFLFEQDQLIKDLRYETIVTKAEEREWRIDTLGDLLPHLDGLFANFECKSTLLEDGEELASIILDKLDLDSFNISSFNGNALRGVHEADSNIAISYLGYLLPYIKWRYFHRIIPLFSINPQVRFVSKSKVDQAHRLGIEVHTFTPNSNEEIFHCFEAGVDVLITDDVNRALELRSDFYQ